MIDPTRLDIPLPPELHDEFMLFACTVHGKQAVSQAAKCNEVFELLQEMWPDIPLRTAILGMDPGELGDLLRTVRMGQYARVVRAWQGVMAVPRPVTAERLRRVHGVGLKTAQFICAYLYGDATQIVLDRHILRWLAGRGWAVPEVTPTKDAVYRSVAALFTLEAYLAGVDTVELDKRIWNEMRVTRKDGKHGEEGTADEAGVLQDSPQG